MSGPSRAELADELAAFGNFVSGVVVLGVDDRSRSVEGIPIDRLDLVESVVREVCNDSISPPLPVRITRLTLPDETGTSRPVLKIDVPRSLFLHKSPGGYLYRLGSSKREMATDMLLRLGQQRSQARIIRFDEQPVPEARPDVLEEPLWRRFLRGDDDDPVRKLRLVVDDDAGEERASVAGVLLCCQEPTRFLPNALVAAVHYRGTAQDSNYQEDAREFSGPLDRQIFDALAWVRWNMSGCRLEVSRAPRPSAVRRSSCVRGARQRGRAPRLLHLRIENSVVPVRRSALLSGAASELDRPGQPGSPASHAQRVDHEPPCAVSRRGRDRRARPWGDHGPSWRRGPDHSERDKSADRA